MEFLNPIFLAGLAAGAIPIAIHLINRRRAKLLPIATLRFLRQIPARTIRRRRLEEYILLAARMLVLCLLALGAAQPIWRSATAGSGATATVVVLDDSYSMEYRVSGVTRFQKAAEAAVKVFRSLKEGDRAALVLASSPAGETLSKDAADALMRRAAAARTGYSAGTLLPGVRKAVELLGAANEPNRELVVITDLQGRAVLALAGKVDDLPKGVRVLVIDVGAPDAANLSVLDVEPGAGLAIAGEPIQVTARILSRGGTGATARVSLVVGEERVAEREVSFEAAGEFTVQLSAVVDDPGAAAGRVILEGDNLVKDDDRHFVLPVAGRIPVLLVNGDPSPISFQDEAFFLRAALDPGHFQVRTVVSPVSLKVIEAGDLDTEDLAPYLAVILANVGGLGDTAGLRLRKYVRGGGGLIIFSGNRVDPAGMNEALGADPELGILPARLSHPAETGDEEDLVSLADVERDHPLVSDLPPEAFRDLRRVHVRSVLGAEPTGGRVLMTLEDDRPLLLERQAGRGRVLLFTTSADADWGNLPIRPIFLPLLHRAVRYAAGTGSGGEGHVIGETVRIPPPPPGAPAPEVVDPEGRTKLLGGERDREGFLTYEPPARPGIFRVRGSGAADEYAFALNVDAGEGDLSRTDPEALEPILGAVKVRVISDLSELETTLVRSREGQPLWVWFLAAALLFLVFEGVFANRIATARARRDAEPGKEAA